MNEISMKTLDLNCESAEEDHLRKLQKSIIFNISRECSAESSIAPTAATDESKKSIKEVISCDRSTAQTSSTSDNSYLTSTDETKVESNLLLTNPLSTSTITNPSIIQNASNSRELRPILQNIVSTVYLGIKLDLDLISRNARNTEYNPNRLNALIMRIREPRSTALIFKTGRMICTGAKDEIQSRISARKFARIIQKIGFAAKFTQFRIHNIVASCDLGFQISLEALNTAHKQFSSYEAELFPGLIYRMVEPKIVLLIFVSGKVVLTGARFREQIFEGFDNILPILKKYGRKQNLLTN